MKDLFNIFGIAPELFWKSGTKYKNYLGFAFSLAYYLSSLTILISIIIEFFSAENSTHVTRSQKYVSEGNLSLDLSQFPMIFGLYDEDGKPIDPVNESFEFEIVMKISKIESPEEEEEETEFISVPLEKCLLEDLGIYRQLFFKDKSPNLFKSHFCLAANKHRIELFDFSKNFYFNHSKIEFLILFHNKNYNNSISKPDNNTIINTNNTIREHSETKEFLLKLIYLDYEIQPTNKTDPGSVNSKSKVFKINNSSRSIFNLSYRSIEFNSDKGLLFSNVKTQFFFQQERTNDFYQTKKLNKTIKISGQRKSHEIIAQVGLSLANVVDVYTLKPLKIHYAFGLLFANSQGIYFVFNFWFYLLCNNLYFFEVSEEISCYGNAKPIKRCSMFSNYKIEKSFGKNSLAASNNSFQTLNSGLKLNKTPKTLENEQAKIKPFDIICNLSCFKSDVSVRKRIKAINNVIKARLSVDFILKKLNELETLKKNAIELNIIKLFNPISIEDLAKLTFGKNEEEKVYSNIINNNNNSNINNNNNNNNNNNHNHNCFDSMNLTAKTSKTKFDFKKDFPLEKSSDAEVKKKKFTFK